MLYAVYSSSEVALLSRFFFFLQQEGKTGKQPLLQLVSISPFIPQLSSFSSFHARSAFFPFVTFSFANYNTTSVFSFFVL